MADSENPRPEPPTLDVAFKRGRLTMRGKGRAIFVIPVIVLIYCEGAVRLTSALARLVSELSMLIG